MAGETQLSVSGKDIKNYLQQLKTNKISYYGVPEEYRLHPDIVKCERELGIRKSGKRGYDVIRNTFYVEEIIYENPADKSVERYLSNVFTDFVSYYNFLDGDIYESACYFQYNFTQTEICTYDIDMSKINDITHIDFTTKDFSVEFSDEELQQYNIIEKEKKLRKQWINKFGTCNTYEEFQGTVNKLKKSKIYYGYPDLLFFLYNYIFTNENRAFDIIMEFVSNGGAGRDFIYGLCFIYDPEKVFDSYEYSVKSKKKRELKDYIKSIDIADVKKEYRGYFDEETHYFCCEINYYISEYFPTVIYRYFYTVQELAEFLGNDLSGCDLSKAILPDVDFSVYKVDNSTQLPIQNLTDMTYSIYKEYDRKEDDFVVRQSWLDINGHPVKEYTNKFKYFADFVFFLDNDLTDADLLFCDGLDNLSDFSNIIFKNARLRSSISDRLGTKYALSTIDPTKVESFLPVIKNEDNNDLSTPRRDGFRTPKEAMKYQIVYYVSDLHLLHNIKNDVCKSKYDVIYTVQKTIDSLLDECKDILLIGGDTSSDFNLFNLFILLLRNSIDEEGRDITVIFLLGNHELWDFPNYSFEEIVQKYKDVISKYNMYLLQNDIIYMDDYNGIQKITTNELLSSSTESIREQIISAKLILFGGLAFSGYNDVFNANNGIYRLTINRNQEITESKRFEKLYNIVKKILSDKRVIVFTHTPQKDWCSNNNPHSGFIYVNGHTHRNYYYDDGKTRVYADNQIGYKNRKPHLKCFYVETTYDCFSEYSDGIYEITKEQYINFYRGQNLMMDFAQDVDILYMLKKNGYYCFIHKSRNNQLAILNGGALKNLKINDINYYYNRMDDVIAYIKNALDKFTSIQKEIATEIKAIGGRGTIHGAVIDIDFRNHIYVNPYDLTITGYWGRDIVVKRVFPSVPRLLESNCPSLYENYLKRLSGEAETALVVISDSKPVETSLPHTYLSTDIYSVSRELTKMQKLYSNILCEWYEPTHKMLE